jgi:murein L,D-transpeptidase YcbB/YkuD
MRGRALPLAGALLIWPALHAVSTNCGTELCTLIASGNLSELRWPDFSDQRQNLERLYESSSCKPIWLLNNEPTPQALKTIEALKDAGSEGLDPRNYDGPLWDGRLSAVRSGAITPNRFDLALSVSALRYTSNRRFGRANPSPVRDADIATWVFQRLASSNEPRAALQELDPPFEDYRRLRAALAAYQGAAQGDSQKLPVPKRPVEPGQPYDDAARLAAVLRRTGDLPSGGAPSKSGKYEGALAQAVKRFQSRHGLDPDGRLGPKTLEELNTRLAHRAGQLLLAMERWRWLPRDQPGPSIIVNIPEFRLRALNASGKTELAMRVVVGKAHGFHTPQFSADMKYLIFRPYWNVPPSIQHKELIPEIEEDASYFLNNNFEVTNSGGAVVSTGRVSNEILQGLRSGAFQIRQRPGPKNALGGLKFVLPNPHDVYLHDTPSRRLFAQGRRDFSHGCIRLEKAAALAAWILEDRPEWKKERILAAMSSGALARQVNLSHPIPVHIVYQTAVVGENGVTYFFDDIYGLDEALYRQLTTAAPFPHPRG